MSHTDPDRFTRDEQVDSAIRRAARNALAEHKRSGNPIAVWKDGKVVEVPAEEIPGPEDADR